MHQSSRSFVAQWFEPFSFDVFFCPRGEKYRAEGLHIAVVDLVFAVFEGIHVYEIYGIYLLLLLNNFVLSVLSASYPTVSVFPAQFC